MKINQVAPLASGCGNHPDRESLAPEGRRSVARGASPWTAGATYSAASQGLAPLAVVSRPSGAFRTASKSLFGRVRESGADLHSPSSPMPKWEENDSVGRCPCASGPSDPEASRTILSFRDGDDFDDDEYEEDEE